MATQIDFHRRSEPSQVVALGVGHQVRRFRKVHFHRHVLEPSVVLPLIEQHNCGWITGERAVGKGVNDVVSKSVHGVELLLVTLGVIPHCTIGGLGAENFLHRQSISCVPSSPGSRTDLARPMNCTISRRSNHLPPTNLHSVNLGRSRSRHRIAATRRNHATHLLFAHHILLHDRSW